MVQGEGAIKVLFVGSLHQTAPDLRHDDRQRTDAPAAPVVGDVAEELVVKAGVDGEGLPLYRPAHHIGVAGGGHGILQSDDVGIRIDQAADRLRSDGMSGAGREVVKIQVPLHVLGQTVIVDEQLFLIHLEIVGADDHGRVAQLIHRVGQGQRIGVADAAGTGQQFHPSVDILRIEAEEVQTLLLVQIRELSGGAQHKNAVQPALDQEIDDFFVACVVGLFLFVEDRDNRRDDLCHRNPPGQPASFSTPNTSVLTAIMARPLMAS